LLHFAAARLDQRRLKIVMLGMIILWLYFCSITSRSTVRLGISCGTALALTRAASWALKPYLVLVRHRARLTFNTPATLRDHAE
jgi:hypothetical protein